MRLAWWWLMLLVAGCDSAAVSGSFQAPSPPPATSGGGGGGANIRVADPLPTAVCPVDYSAELERRIALVADRRARDSLYVQWRMIEKIANAGNTEEILSATQAFRLIVDRLERHGDINAEQAGQLRGPLRCYLP
jgi:hypothetical protein